MNKELCEAIQRRRDNPGWQGLYYPYPTSVDDVILLADAYLAEHPADDDAAIDEMWLRSIGALPDGDNGHDFSIKIWEKGQTETYDEEISLHVLISLPDTSIWIEAYNPHGESLAIIELGIQGTRGQLRRLLAALGVEEKD